MSAAQHNHWTGMARGARPMTPAHEKAAPFPADVLERFFETLAPTPTEREKTIAALAAGYVAAALLADRASREERIREDEREACAKVARESFGYIRAETDPDWVANRIRTRLQGDDA